MYICNDFQCNDCNHIFEDLWKKPTWEGQVECPECGSKELTKLLGAPGIAAYSLLDKAGKTACLKKRSLEHSKKLMKRDMDKHRGRVKKKIDALKR